VQARLLALASIENAKDIELDGRRAAVIGEEVKQIVRRVLMKTLLSMIVGASMLGLVGGAIADEPLTLSAAQMDQVSAGYSEAGMRWTAGNDGPVVQGTVGSASSGFDSAGNPTSSGLSAAGTGRAANNTPVVLYVGNY
jgi:hypothetical protein